jgi:N-acetylneuraminic acid mutarotase
MKYLIPIFLLVLQQHIASAQCTAPTITAGGPTTFCAGNNVTLSAPKGDNWNRVADFGGEGRRSAVSFSIGNKGYMGTGYSPATSSYKDDFWEYDPATNAWTQKANLGGRPRNGAVGFAIGNKGYIGTG